MLFPLASRPPPYTHARPNRARFSREQAEAAGSRRNELRHRAAQLQLPYAPIHLANRGSHTLDIAIRFVHYIVSLGVRHLFTQRLRHPAPLRDARIAKTKGRMPLHLPRSLKLQIVPKLKPFGVGDNPRVEAVWHLRTLTGRALCTPAKRPARSRHSTPRQKSKRPWRTTLGPQAFPRMKAPVAWP